MPVSERVLRTLAVALSLAVGVACASAPGFRPAAPAMGSAVVEAGIGPHAAFGRESMAVGTSAWVSGEVAEGIDVFVRGSGADIFPYQGAQAPFADVLASGGAGVRWTSTYLDGLVLGAEGMAEYEQRTGPSAAQLVVLTGGMPVAERVVDGLWAYTDVQLGLAVPLYAGAPAPFFGYAEVPLGLAWQVTPWLVVVGEGGVYLPLAGGYGALAVGFRL